MSLVLIQIVILLCAALTIASVIRRFAQKELSRSSAFGWLMLWGGIFVAVLIPRTTEWLARTVGVGRGTDAVLYLSVVFLFFVQYRTLLRLEKMDHAITEAVRARALQELEKTET